MTDNKHDITIATQTTVNQRDLYMRILAEKPHLESIMDWLRAFKFRLQSRLNVNLAKSDQAHVMGFVLGQIDAVDRMLDIERIAIAEIDKMNKADEEDRAKDGSKVQKLDQAVKRRK